MLTLTGGDIPEQLQGIADAPRSLYVEGCSLVELMNRPRIAVVGTRNVSPYGKLVTESLTDELSRSGIVIISGLALGVDSLAHRATLNASGTTIAVLPGGIKKIYPRSHESLARRIVNEGGALISEKAQSESPRPFDFLNRNRLISGLADAVLITEAASRSGSLNTARHALEQGKTIFAVPGNINSPLSEGTNNLIKMGALLVSSAKDIFSAMGWQSSDKPHNTPVNLPKNQLIIYNLIKSGLTSGEELLLKSDLINKDFTEALTMLELEGLIFPMGSNNWGLK